ncbi:fasciclin domain-containing protein [Acetobacter estunensis]|uniref:fasciclin domain-containing protein n=1 Tax=Acetobacter estunensis TaxID=104097 RepID=UPI0020C5AD0A|nr:fasciclin domain-containing protein [Acetobacter estunensis]
MLTGRYGAAGAMMMMALSLGACQSPARQDAYKVVGSSNSFMAPTVSGARNYTPAGEKDAPNSNVAYPDPETPIYYDRPLSESILSAIELGNYSRALQVSGYDRLLQMAGPYTVFAIPNEPMKHVSEQYPGGLLDPANAQALKNLMGFTIVPGKWSVDRLRRVIARMPTHAVGLRTLSGAFLTVSVEPGTNQLVLSNAAGTINRIWVTGIPQSNGMLYFTQSALPPVFPALPVAGQSQVAPGVKSAPLAAPASTTH